MNGGSEKGREGGREGERKHMYCVSKSGREEGRE